MWFPFSVLLLLALGPLVAVVVVVVLAQPRVRLAVVRSTGAGRERQSHLNVGLLLTVAAGNCHRPTTANCHGKGIFCFTA